MTTKHTPEPVKRYDRTLCGTGFHTHEEMKQSELGDWVRYDDIKPLLDALNSQHAEIERMRVASSRVLSAHRSRIENTPHPDDKYENERRDSLIALRTALENRP